MKRILIIMALTAAAFINAKADDRPRTFEQLPKAAQTFITSNFPDDKVSFATVDDDIIAPDYQVVLVSGVRLGFQNNGKLEKIETKDGNIPAGIIPAQILEAVKGFYPDAIILEYEVGRRSYEVKLSNRMELKFNSSFKIVELDD